MGIAVSEADAPPAVASVQDQLLTAAVDAGMMPRGVVDAA